MQKLILKKWKKIRAEAYKKTINRLKTKEKWLETN